MTLLQLSCHNQILKIQTWVEDSETGSFLKKKTRKSVDSNWVEFPHSMHQIRNKTYQRIKTNSNFAKGQSLSSLDPILLKLHFTIISSLSHVVPVPLPTLFVITLKTFLLVYPFVHSTSIIARQIIDNFLMFICHLI